MVLVEEREALKVRVRIVEYEELPRGQQIDPALVPRHELAVEPVVEPVCLVLHFGRVGGQDDAYVGIGLQPLRRGRRVLAVRSRQDEHVGPLLARGPRKLVHEIEQTVGAHPGRRVQRAARAALTPAVSVGLRDREQAAFGLLFQGVEQALFRDPAHVRV